MSYFEQVEKHTSTFGARLKTFARWLESLPLVTVVQAEFGDPLTEEELSRVNERLGFELDERFVDYFRECNGWALRWVESEETPEEKTELEKMFYTEVREGILTYYGKFLMPGLDVLFCENTGTGDTMEAITRGTREMMIDPKLDGPVEFPGCTSEATLRNHSYSIGAYGRIPGGNYRRGGGEQGFEEDIFLYASPENRDPIAYLVTDYQKNLTPGRPMLARTFFDLGLAFLGSSELLDWFAKGSDGGALLDLDTSKLPLLFFNDQDTEHGRNQFSRQYLSALGKQANVGRYSSVDAEFPDETMEIRTGDMTTTRSFPYSAPFESSKGHKSKEFVTRIRDLGIFEHEELVKDFIQVRFLFGGESLETCEAMLLVGSYHPEEEGFSMAFADLVYGEDFPRDALKRVLALCDEFDLKPEWRGRRRPDDGFLYSTLTG